MDFSFERALLSNVSQQMLICYLSLLLFTDFHDFSFLTSRTLPVMGNSASTSFVTTTPKKLSWGRHEEDTVRLEDILTQNEENLWGVKTKQSVKKLHLTRGVRYTDLTFQEEDGFHPKRGANLNPAFVGDQGP